MPTANGEYTISELKTLPAGTAIGSVMATIAEVKPQRTVTTATGQVTVQDLKLTQGADWIICAVWGHPDYTAHKGKTYIFHSVTKGANLVGLKVKDSLSKDGSKTYKNLEVGRQGRIQFVEVYRKQTGAVPTATPSLTGGVTVSADVQCEREPHPADGDACNLSAVKTHLNKTANLYMECLVAAHYVRDSYKEMGFDMTPEQFQACASTLFICSDKAGLVSKMKVGPYLKKEPAPSTGPVDTVTINGPVVTGTINNGNTAVGSTGEEW